MRCLGLKPVPCGDRSSALALARAAPVAALTCACPCFRRPIQTVGPPSRWLLSQNGDMGVADGRDDSESPSASSESDSEQRRSGSAPGSARGEAAGGENGPGDGEEHSDGRRAPPPHVIICVCLHECHQCFFHFSCQHPVCF